MTPEFCNIAYLNQKEVGTIPDVIKKHCGISDRNVCVVGIPHKMIIGKECIIVSKETQKTTAMYYTCSKQFMPEYLASVLNSNLGMRFLLGTSIRKKQIVFLSENNLIKVPIFLASEEYQKGLGNLQLLIQFLYEHKDNVIRNQLMLDMFEDIRDGMILELYFSEEFKKRGIRLWESWNNTLLRGSILVSNQNILTIYNSIRLLSSPVRQSLKHIQVLRNSPNFEF